MDIRHCFVPNLPGIIEIDEKQEAGKRKGDGGAESEEDGKEGRDGGGEEDGGGEGEKNKILREGSEFESTKKVIIMAKHLCGVATDLALRSLESFKIQNTNTNGKCLLPL